MATQITSTTPPRTTTIADPVKGKFERLSDWIGEHKRELAVAMLVIGVASMAFGLGAVLAIVPLSNFTALHFALFAVNLFTYNGGMISGLSTTGYLFFTGIGALIAGGTLAGFGSGVLAGSPKK